MDKLCHNSIANTYAVDSDKYCFALLKDMDEASASFSISTWDMLRGNKIYFVSDLLNHSVSQLKNLDGFADDMLREIQRFAIMLQNDHPLPLKTSGEQEEPEEIATIDLQKLKKCQISLPIATPFAQKYSIKPDTALNAHLFSIDLPNQISKKLVLAGFSKINDVLMLSPERLIREAGITLLDLPEVEGCISTYVCKAYGTLNDATEETLMPLPPATTEIESICSNKLETHKFTEHLSEIAAESPVSEQNETHEAKRVLQAESSENTHVGKIEPVTDPGNVPSEVHTTHMADPSVHTSEPPAQNERIVQTKSEEKAHQPQPSKNGAHVVVEVPAEALEKTYAEIFGLRPELHANTPISELNLSVRTHNVFKRNEITTLDVLLKKTPESLMQLKNFGKTSLQDVERLMESLKGGNPTEKAPSPAKTQIRESVPLELRPYARQMANGDFSFMEDLTTPSHILPAAERCKEAQIALGTELANACLDTPQALSPIISACFTFRFAVQQQNDLQVFLDAIPAERRYNKVHGYINAYVKNEEKRTKLHNLYTSADATVNSILNTELNGEQHRFVSAFLKWCSYDLSVEIEELLKSVYANDRMRTVIQMRAQKKTLEQIGTILGVTRERARQIELKAKGIFRSRQGRIKIISKIAADLNGSSVVMPGDLMDYCGSHFDEILFLLRTCESSNFTYDQTLDLFIVGDDSMQDRTAAFIESLPEMFTIDEIVLRLHSAEEDFDLPEEVAKIAISEVYNLTGEIYHRNRLSRAAIYQEILRESFPNGIYIHNQTEIAQFRDLVHKKYGNVSLPYNDHALAARIADICILCDRGQYRLKQKKYIPRTLATQIHSYMENSDHSIFMTNTLFHVFENELRANGVNNKYYLQGILHELYGDQYTFTRDYISKDASITSIYSSVVNHIKKSQHPVSKKQLKKAFPGVPEVALNLATGDPEVLQYLGEYLHSSKLVVSEQEKAYLHSIVAQLLQDGQPHHSEECYNIVMMERPEIFTRNAVSFQYRCFSVLEYLFRNQYEFSRPYIAPLGTEIGRPIEQIREYVDENDRISITDISSYAAEIHFRLPSTLGFINSCNDRYLLISNELMMLQEDTGVDESIAHLVEDLVFEEITDPVLIRSLPCWMKLPPINVPWTEWLVYSVLNKWATRVEVAPSHNQFRMAVPLVAPKGKMQVEPFAEVYREIDCTAGNLSVSISNDMDHIDDLLMELTDDELLEDDLWD